MHFAYMHCTPVSIFTHHLIFSAFTPVIIFTHHLTFFRIKISLGPHTQEDISSLFRTTIIPYFFSARHPNYAHYGLYYCARLPQCQHKYWRSSWKERMSPVISQVFGMAYGLTWSSKRHSWGMERVPMALLASHPNQTHWWLGPWVFTFAVF